jgi:predicted ATP-binding protein involved in virulence
MPNLNIQSLKLRDYRCFERIDIDFHPQLTVLVAANGAGKTSILDAVAVAFGPFIGAFDEAVGKHSKPATSVSIGCGNHGRMRWSMRQEACVFLPKVAFRTAMKTQFRLAPSIKMWRRSLSGPTKSKTTIKDAKDLIEYGKRLQEAVRTPGGNALLPLVAYYGTGRLWQQKKLTENKKIERTSRTVGYADCLDPASSYKAFVAWFRYWNLNAKEARIIAQETGRTTTATEFDGYIGRSPRP